MDRSRSQPAGRRAVGDLTAPRSVGLCIRYGNSGERWGAWRSGYGILSIAGLPPDGKRALACYAAWMPDYLLSLRSDRSTFSIGFDAEDDAAAVKHAILLIVKARAPVGASVTIVRPDRTELDISGAVAPYLDRPEF